MLTFKIIKYNHQLITVSQLSNYMKSKMCTKCTVIKQLHETTLTFCAVSDAVSNSPDGDCGKSSMYVVYK
jgi:hypothetical protein